MRPIAELYHQFTNLGITDKLSFSEKLRVELNNLFLGLALFFLSIHLSYLLIVKPQFSSLIITSTWILVLLVPLYLNYRSKYFIAKVYTIIIPGTALGVVHYLHGWDARMEPTYIMMILLSAFFFQRRLTIIMSGYIILVFVIVAALLFTTEPPLADRLLPIIPFIYLTFSVIACLTLVRKVLVENDNFNRLALTQNQALAKKNKQLEKFTYIASHDLKTPIRNITSFSTLIERDINKGEVKRIPEHLDFIKNSALQMSTLVEDILQISTVDYADAEIRNDCDLDLIVAQVSQALLNESSNKRSKVNNQGLPHYHCNASEMYLVFQNLIQNGLKYNQHQRPQVDIWSEERADQLLIHVKDNGIGIEPQYHEQIFEFFKRLHSSAEYEGTGLGLGLCKRIIESYNGQLNVQSTLRQGSTFTIYLPKM